MLQVHERFHEAIGKTIDIDAIGSLELRELLRKKGICYGKGVSAIRREDAVELLTTGKIPARIKALGLPITFGHSGRKRRRKKSNYVAPVASAKLATVAPSLPVHNGGEVTYHTDGLTICAADQAVVNAAHKDWKWYPKDADELHKRLNQVGYIIDRSDAEVVFGWLDVGGDGDLGVRTLVCDGVAGTGKSFLAKKLASLMLKDRNAFIVDSMHPDSRPGDLLSTLDVDVRTTSGMQEYRGKIARAALASQYGKVVLFIEEYEKSKPMVDDALLQFLQDGVWDYGKASLRANTDNLVIIFAKNDTRPLMVPLIRRIRFMSFVHQHPSLMAAILHEMLPSRLHKHVPFLVLLYVRSVKVMVDNATVDRAATAQELAQLILSIDAVGTPCDIGAMIRSTVTKDDDVHRMLMASQSFKPTMADIDRLFAKSDAQSFNPGNWGSDLSSTVMQSTPNGVDASTRLPRGKRWKHGQSDETPEGATAIAKLDERIYDALAKIVNEPSAPGKLGKWSIVGDQLVLKHDFDITKGQYWKALKVLQDEALQGEVKCVIPGGSVGLYLHMIENAENYGLKVTRKSQETNDGSGLVFHAEIDGSPSMYIEVRRGKNGIELIAPLENGYNLIRILMGRTTPSVAEAKWAPVKSFSAYKAAKQTP